MRWRTLYLHREGEERRRGERGGGEGEETGEKREQGEERGKEKREGEHPSLQATGGGGKR